MTARQKCIGALGLAIWIALVGAGALTHHGFSGDPACTPDDECIAHAR